MEKGLKTLTTAGRAARRHDFAKQTTPPISELDFSDTSLPISHSPAGSINPTGSIISNQQLSAYRYVNTLPSQRHSSISSNGSIVNATNLTANTMAKAQQLYNTTRTASSSYMSNGVAPNNYMAYAQPSNTPSMNRNYESVPEIQNSSRPNSLPLKRSFDSTTDLDIAHKRAKYRKREIPQTPKK